MARYKLYAIASMMCWDAYLPSRHILQHLPRTTCASSRTFFPRHNTACLWLCSRRSPVSPAFGFSALCAYAAFLFHVGKTLSYSLPTHRVIFIFFEKIAKKFGDLQKMLYLCTRLKQVRAFSSVGLEHLPYKQRVGGVCRNARCTFFFSLAT